MNGSLKESIKLNSGCSLDRRSGYINVDGGAEHAQDKVIVFPEDRLVEYYGPESVDKVLIQDFLEHHSDGGQSRFSTMRVQY